MNLVEIDDFILVKDDPFLVLEKEARLDFDITWKDTSSKLVINCRDVSRKVSSFKNTTKITSVTIPEFKGIHNELSAIEPKINSYFPENFTFQIFTIERPNTRKSWGLFSMQSPTVIEEDKDFSEKSKLEIQNYLRAVVEICGKELLFNVLFKDENATYFEDKEEFIIKKSNENILNCKNRCSQLLESHDQFENLQSLTEDLYKQEDSALEEYKESIFEKFLIVHNKVNEKIEMLIVKLQKLFADRKSTEIGPRIIEEINQSISEHLNDYYIHQRISINMKLEMSKSLKSIYSGFISEMLNDKSKYENIIFRDCVGSRLSDLSLLYHTENENVSHYNLLLHSTDELIFKRKLQLIWKWEEGKVVVKPNIRHEDYSLIQLKNLNSTKPDISEIEKFYIYISHAYKLLLNYYEARRFNLLNQIQIIDDPINVIPPVNLSVKARLINLNINTNDERNSYQTINMSTMLNIDEEDSDEEFEDAIDDVKFQHLKNIEIQKIKLKDSLQNELKSIANIKAELRNSQHQLKVQYERLKNKMVDVTDNVSDSLPFASLYPESNAKPPKKSVPVPGSNLTKEQRILESKKAAERIRNYNLKLKGKEPKKTKIETSTKKSSTNVAPSISQLSSPCSPPVPPPPPPVPPPPPLAPPPPPPPGPPPIVKLIKNTNNNKSSGIQVSTGNLMNELKSKLANRSSEITSSDIDRSTKKDKNKSSNDLFGVLSSMMNDRRLFISNNDDDFDE